MQIPRGFHSEAPQEGAIRLHPQGIEGPPKHAVSSVMGFLKGKSSIWIAQNVAGKQRNFVGHKFWARGYFVSTVGADEKTIRTYIQNQESDDKRLDSLNLFNRV